MVKYREIKPSDDARVAGIARYNLKKFHLDLPGTVYFDPELDHLSTFYSEKPDKRRYFVALGKDGQVIGGAGFAEFEGLDDCAELQKLYLWIPLRGKATEKIWYSSLRRAQKRQGTRACIWKHIQTFP